MLRVGIVGCGFIGTVHSYAIHGLVEGGLVDARVTAVVDSDERRAEAIADLHGADVAPDLGSLVEAVDVVWVCTPTAAHRRVVEAAAAAGRAVFCEKPLGRDLAEAEAVARALEPIPHQVGLVLRSCPVFLTLRRELDVGSHGRPMAVVFRDDQYFPDQGIYGSTWRGDVEQAGGGTLIEHSIHDLDLVRFLFGDPEMVSGRTLSFSDRPGIDDVATVELTFGTGLAVSLTSVWHQILSRPSTRRVEVFCEEALLWLDDDHVGPLHLETSGGTSEIACPLPEWVEHLAVPGEVRKPIAMYATPAKSFLDALSDEKTGSPGAADALAAHRLVDAAYRSAARAGLPARYRPPADRAL